jgi:hypothetical protein
MLPNLAGICGRPIANRTDTAYRISR